jgi:ribose 1,5-bisphosphokinase
VPLAALSVGGKSRRHVLGLAAEVKISSTNRGPEDMRRAPIIYVMGPSGAGKDSVLRYARKRVGGRHPVVFAHRYITRPPTPDDENHIALSETEFDLRHARGLFAMSWTAHGLRYGIGAEIAPWREAGLVVVVSGSRDHFQQALGSAADVIPVVVTANPVTIAARLAARGREDERAIAARLGRGKAFSISHEALVTIDNSGPVERAGEQLTELLIAAAQGM